MPKAEKKVYGKITKVDVGPTIDESMVKSGHEVFETKCSACHKMDERYVGPALGTVATRRTPEYVMNMILDTETMIQNDDTVKCLLQEYLVQMPNQSVDEKDARNVPEYLRTHSGKREQKDNEKSPTLDYGNSDVCHCIPGYHRMFIR